MSFEKPSGFGTFHGAQCAIFGQDSSAPEGSKANAANQRVSAKRGSRGKEGEGVAMLLMVGAMIAWYGLLIYLGHRFPVVKLPAKAYLANFLAGVAATVIGLPLSYLTGGLAIWATQATGLQLDLLHPDQIGVGVSIIDQALRLLAMIFVPLAVYDLWLAFSHRLEHHVPFLWDVHRIHHSDRWMNPLTVFRDHFLQGPWRGFFSMLTIGLFVDLNFKEGGQAALYSQMFLFAWAALCHSNIRVELPWLEGILVTPQYHRIHHSVQPEHSDKNFADIFPIFDRLFGSSVRPKPGEFPETGLHSGERIDGIGGIIVAPLMSWFGRLRRLFGKHPAPDARQA